LQPAHAAHKYFPSFQWRHWQLGRDRSFLN
jgi:hypothetical protein